MADNDAPGRVYRSLITGRFVSASMSLNGVKCHEYIRADVVREMMIRAAELADYRMNISPEKIADEIIKERSHD